MLDCAPTHSAPHTYSWQRKLPLLKTPEESTWLYHELGRCHYELESYAEAQEMGEKSLAAAREAQDNMWQLNASVLIAQAESGSRMPSFCDFRLL